jgi:hypothetical protein
MKRETCTGHGRRKITGDGAGGTDGSQLRSRLVFAYFAGSLRQIRLSHFERKL